MLVRDLKYEFNKIKKYLIFIFVISTIFMLDSVASNENPINYFLLNVSRDMGMVYDLRDFVLPFVWLIFYILPVFSLVDIIYKDHIESGTYVMLKAKNKRRYFFSKLISSSILIICIFLAIFIMFILIFSINGTINILDINKLFRIFCSYLMENIVLIHMALFFTVLIYQRIALVIIILNLCLAMFTNLKFIIGQGSLVMKQDIFGGEFSFLNNMIVIIIFICSYSGLIYILAPKYNYYGSKNVWY